LKFLFLGLIPGLLPYFTARWHWDYGHPELWGPITGTQATNTALWFNIYMMSVIMVSPKRRLVASLMATIGTTLQYVFCWELYMNAAVPYIHFVDLLTFGYSLIFLIYQIWWED